MVGKGWGGRVQEDSLKCDSQNSKLRSLDNPFVPVVPKLVQTILLFLPMKAIFRKYM